MKFYTSTGAQNYVVFSGLQENSKGGKIMIRSMMIGNQD